MRRSTILISAAWLMHATAWMFPTVNGVYGLELQGWQAFWVAVGAVWHASNYGAWYSVVLASASALTTVWFVAGSPWAVFRASRALRRASARIAAAGFLINAHWLILWGPKRSELMIGYYLWWWSFIVLAIGLYDLAQRQELASERQSAPAP